MSIPASIAETSEGLMSVELVLDLLELLAQSAQPRGVSDVAATLGISKARAHRHLRALLARGYARQIAETERYVIGTQTLLLAGAARERFDFLAAARPEMARLRDRTGHSVTASALVDGSVVVLELLRGTGVVEFGIRPGAKLELHASAHGRIALAFGPPELARRILASRLARPTPATLTDPAALRAELSRVRKRGWAAAADQTLLGINALAAPVFDDRGTLCGAIAIVGPTQFIAAQPSAELVRAVVAAAKAASRQLGHRSA